ncbi:LysR substrate-binding domain-containing protein [Dokdonella sp.]|uniref:LysR substrate-binding domain-containing protein n=1 Tax=Dokdonella sp. TaxID=2291710 RepID=UPI0031C8A20E|nr:LysR substrate-binding domain-containing protein [Dokdonella sp.]
MLSSPVLDDLNDLKFFAAVVEHGGFSAAGRALGVPKSRLSKRIARLEERLGVRLLQRTTRRFSVTPIGERFHAHCRAVLEEARAAQDVVDALRAEPRGSVRVSCPIALAQTLLAQVLPDFALAYPKVQVRVLASNRRVDVINEGFDLAIRVRTRLDSDQDLVLRSFGQSRVRLVASPAFLDAQGRPAGPADLAAMPYLSTQEQEGAQIVQLIDRQGGHTEVTMQARIICGEFAVLKEAAIRGVGVAALPDLVCASAVERGELEVVLPEWSMPLGTMHFVYPSRRGQLAGVRAFIDFLAERLPGAVQSEAAR